MQTLFGTNHKRAWRRAAAAAGLAVLAATCVSTPVQAHGNDSVQGMFHAGALYGQVVDNAGKPVSNATVALQDRHGRVVAWTQTDADGRYRLAANSLAALDLETHRRNALQSIGRGFVEVIKLPVNMTGVAVGAAANTVVGAVKAIDPIGTVKAAAVSAAEGNPTPLARQAASDVSNLLSLQSQKTVRGNAASAIVYPKGKPASPPHVGPQPGQAMILVSAPQYKEFDGIAGSYYMTPGASEGDGAHAGAKAWLDTVQLAPQSDAKTLSGTRDQAAVLSNVALSPAFAAAGGPIKITAQLQAPADPDVQVRVIARVQSTHQVVELLPTGNGAYSGTLWLDPATPLGNTTVTIAALAATPVNATINPSGSSDPYLAWAGSLDCMDADKPYDFDPRIMGSENRIDVKMMVLNPSLETPPATSGG